jgi:hypothetical protein
MEISEIVESFKLDKVLALKEKDLLFDFIPSIKLRRDMPILKTWAEYLKSTNIPYAITKGAKGYTLWKELIEPPMQNRGKKFQ